MAWYNASWGYRQKVTVDKTKIGGADQTNFPVYVDLANMQSGFVGHVEADGKDLRVTTVDGTTECPLEVVSVSNGGSAGELHFKAPSLGTAANTDFYVYYGNAGASAYAAGDTYGRNNVWSVFDSVYHLNEAAGTIFTDSAGLADALMQGDLPDTARGGKVGNGQDFDGTGDFGTTTSYLNFGSSDFTISGWVYPDATDNIDIVSRWTPNWDFRIGYSGYGENGKLCLFYKVATAEQRKAGGTIVASAWQYISCLVRSNNFYYFNSGTSYDLGAWNTTIDSGTAVGVQLGSFGGNIPWNGMMDEIRIKAGTGMTEAWLNAEYNNQNSPATFYAVSAEETPPAAGYKQKVTLMKVGG